MKTRIVHTRMWNDDLICKLEPKEKLLFVYLLTNERNNLIGTYEISDNRIIADTGLTHKELTEGKTKLELVKKVFFLKGWVKITNHDKYNSFKGSKIAVAKEREFSEVPQEILDLDTSIDTSTDSLSNHIINNHIINKKKKTKKTYTKDNLTLQEVADKILLVFNEVMGTRHRNTKVFINNLEKCLENHEPLEIAQAIEQIKYDSFWSKVATPEKIFRQSKDGQPKDYIEDLLNQKKENYARR